VHQLKKVTHRYIEGKNVHVKKLLSKCEAWEHRLKFGIILKKFKQKIIAEVKIMLYKLYIL